MNNLYLFKNKYEIEGYQGQMIELDGELILDPTEEELREYGYKDLVMSIRPMPKRGYTIISYFEDGEQITQIFELIKNKKG